MEPLLLKVAPIVVISVEVGEITKLLLFWTQMWQIGHSKAKSGIALAALSQ